MGCLELSQCLLQALLIRALPLLPALQAPLLSLQRLCQLQQVRHRLRASQPSLRKNCQNQHLALGILCKEIVGKSTLAERGWLALLLKASP